MCWTTLQSNSCVPAGGGLTAASIAKVTACSITVLGGADGALLHGLDNPLLHGIVLERPEVAVAATAGAKARGIADLAEAIAGDFFAAVPPGDLYLLCFILHTTGTMPGIRILGELPPRHTAGRSRHGHRGLHPSSGRGGAAHNIRHASFC